MEKETRNVWNDKIKEALKEIVAVIWIMTCMVAYFATWIYLLEILPVRDIEMLHISMFMITILIFGMLSLPGFEVLEKSKIQLCNRGLEKIESIIVQTSNKICRKIKESTNRKRTNHIPAI